MKERKNERKKERRKGRKEERKKEGREQRKKERKNHKLSNIRFMLINPSFARYIDVLYIIYTLLM